jgi:quinol monooxygenase YgiN
MFRILLIGSVALIGAAAIRPAHADVRVYIHEEMTDYTAFQKAYNSFAATRKKMGVIRATVYQNVDNKNDVTITHDFKTLAKANAFLALPDLKTSMQSVAKGPPQIWVTTPGAK